MIDPYSLLGVNIDSSEKKIRQSYYQLALLCHPDRGGNNEEMKTLHQAYSYIMKEVSYRQKNPTTEAYLYSEKEFEAFCNNQKQTPPPFEAIYQENNVFIQTFNKKWEAAHKEQRHQDPSYSTSLSNFNDKGYGDDMEQSEYAFSLSPPSSSGPPSTSSLESSYTESKARVPVKKKFSKQLIAYEEPQSLPEYYGGYQRLDKEAETDNFSHKTQSGTALTDYAQAFSPPEEIVEDGSRLDLELDVQSSLEKLQRQRKTQEATIQRQNDDFWDKEESYDTLNQKKPVRTTTI